MTAEARRGRTFPIEDYLGEEAGGLEGRRRIALFTLVHPHYFENLDRVTGGTDYRRLVAEAVPAAWRRSDSGVWHQAEPPGTEMAPQGFKLHVSAALGEGEGALRRIVPVLVEHETPFKVLRNRALHLLANSKQFGRGSAGKFATVYPRSEPAFLALGEALAEVLGEVAGPYILSDRRFREARAVYYRYGGFRSPTELTPYGYLRYLIQDGRGNWIEDKRSPYFELPPGVADPLEAELAAESGQGGVVLAGRYEPVEAITFSTSGGIYKARDRQTGEIVLVKEARPGIYGVTLADTGIDATELLDREARVLRRLAGVEQVPRFVDRFREWEHEYLVEEYCAGYAPFTGYRAQGDLAIVAAPRDRARIRRFSSEVAELGLNLIAAVEAVHARGVILGDLSPANVLVDPATRAVRLIDFEGAQIAGESGAHDQVSSFYGTQGYMHAGRLRGEKLGIRDDWYAVGMMLYGLSLPLEAFLALKPAALEDFETQLVRNANIPAPLFEAARALRAADVAGARAALDELGADAKPIAARLARRRGRRAQDSRRRRREAERAVRRILADLRATAEPERTDRIWPGDFKVFSTNPWGFALGAGGPLSLFARAGEEPPEQVLERAQREPLNGTIELPPGLMAGHAGLAWALADLGRIDAAGELAAAAAASPLLEQDPTLFHGLAGYGMTRLRLYSAEQTAVHLEEAAGAGRTLLGKAQAAGAGLRWACWSTGKPATGIAYGGSGIAMFLLRLFEATGDPSFREAAVAGLEADLALAKYPLGDGLPRWGGGEDDERWDPYWLGGGAGVAAVLARFAGALKEERYYGLACAAAAGAYTPVLSAPGQFLGTSGVGETMLDLHVLTGERMWLERAWQLADVTRLFELRTEAGAIYPGRFHLRRSHDYAFGSSGVGHFLFRLAHGRSRLFHDPGAGFWEARYDPAPLDNVSRKMQKVSAR